MVNKSQEFHSSIEIDNYFKSFNASGFVDWFNTNISSNTIWGIRISNQANWQKLWSNVDVLFGKSSVNLVEFLCMNSIFVNETGGKFLPLTESVGSSGHPGISYAFDTIPGTKKSYNTLDTNKTALQLFNDPIYINAHGHKPYGSLLTKTSDHRWSGEFFPVGFSGNADQEINKSGKTNTFLTEADYYKFRGRGYIQITGRDIYKSLIDFIIKYNGSNAVINSTKKIWNSHKNLDDIASISTNEQWDALFQKTDSIIPNYAVYVHSTLPSAYKNYNIINPNQSDANLSKSIKKVGLGVSGSSQKYADLFLQRVMLQLHKLDIPPSPSISPTASVPQSIPEENPGRLESTGQDPTNKNNISGTVPTNTNIFKPTNTPGAISFNI